jgi:hypothetical protein
LARAGHPLTPTRVKTWRLFGVIGAGVLMGVGLGAQGPEIDLPRPGSILVLDLTGEATIVTPEQTRKLKADDRVRVGASVATGRRSVVTLAFSNGTSVQLGPEAEIEIEEFGQAPVTNPGKFTEIKAEPTLSRTRLKLVRGDITVNVKPLKIARGSSFVLSTLAGNLRTGEAAFRAMLRVHDLGLGVCTIDVQTGAAEFDVVGSAGYAPVAAPRKLAFALDVDKNGVAKVSEMPKETPAKK